MIDRLTLSNLIKFRSACIEFVASVSRFIHSYYDLLIPSPSLASNYYILVEAVVHDSEILILSHHTETSKHFKILFLYLNHFAIAWIVKMYWG